MNKEQVLQLVTEKDVKFARIWFPDIFGFLKSFAITVEELEGALDEGFGFDGSSIKGYTGIEESDMVAKPDPATFQIVPWRPKEKAVARFFCDILNPDGTPFQGDPRYCLKRALDKAQGMGFDHFYCGPELEYFYFKDDCACEILDRGGYFDLTTLDAASDLRRDTILALEQMGIKVEMSHHEVAYSQHEIDLRYQDALPMADAAMTMRAIVKEIATKYGYYATFMPKPIAGINGSGMHVHQSLFKGTQNAFYDASDDFNLSGQAKSFIAGILKYAPEFVLVTNQWVNSYKRLVPGYEAPVYIAWARRNRSALIRVPMYKPGKEEATRIEVRCPDPAGNPYLQFAVMLQAGLKGIEDKLAPPDPLEKNIFKLTETEMKNMGVSHLPGSLGRAIASAEASPFLKKALGEHIFENLLTVKKLEWTKYKIYVSPWEIEEYLHRL